VVKRCAKARLERKIKLDFAREKRFEEDVRRFWRNKIGWRGRP
jgi:triacylglycerol esterase/lipase EstA (alpha/beta hydrolase family)